MLFYITDMNRLCITCAATCRNNRVYFSFGFQFPQKEVNELFFNTLVTLVYALHYFTARPAMG